MLISDWSSDVYSSDRLEREDGAGRIHLLHRQRVLRVARQSGVEHARHAAFEEASDLDRRLALSMRAQIERFHALQHHPGVERAQRRPGVARERSEEHTSELQSLMRISYAVFCLKQKKT